MDWNSLVLADRPNGFAVCIARGEDTGPFRKNQGVKKCGHQESRKPKLVFGTGQLHMGRTRKTPVYMIVGDAIGCIGKDRVLDLDSNPAEPLCDELQCPIADEILVSLRKAFTLSYPRNPFIDGLTQALQKIRRVCVDALIEMPEVLEELKWPKIPPVMDDPRVGRTHVFKYFLTRTSDLSIKVKYKGKSQSLLKLLEPVAADPLIRTVREIISMTFSEMFSEEQHDAVLRRIRDQIWEVLPPFNEYLVSIEVEPNGSKA